MKEEKLRSWFPNGLFKLSFPLVYSHVCHYKLRISFLRLPVATLTLLHRICFMLSFSHFMLTLEVRALNPPERFRHGFVPQE
jgi:hypothetical protein